MRMKEEDLDKILTNENIDPSIRLAALEYHAQDNINREKGILTAIISLIIIGAAAAFLYSYSNKGPTEEPIQPVIEQPTMEYITPNYGYK